MVEQIGEIAGEQLDRVRACRLVRFTDGRGSRRPGPARAASRSATGCQNRGSMASEWMSTTPFVPCPASA
jgi:hypothetical protein